MSESEEKKLPVLRNVYDAENDKWIEVTREQQSMAAYVHQQVLLGVFVSAMAIKKVFDERLYLALGCQTRDEYIDMMLPYGRRQVYRLISIAEKFDGVYGNLLQNKELADVGSTDSSKLVTLKSLNSPELKEINDLGVTKLYELVKLDDDELSELVKKGKTKVNGNDISLEEIKDASAREVSKIISEAKKKMQSKIDQLTEDVSLLKEEKKLLDKRNKQLEERILNAEEIEKKYGGTASLIEHKREMLNKANSLLNDFNEVIIRTGINDEDPSGLQEDLVNLIRKIDEVHGRVSNYYQEVTVNF